MIPKSETLVETRTTGKNGCSAAYGKTIDRVTAGRIIGERLPGKTRNKTAGRCEKDSQMARDNGGETMKKLLKKI